jgi:hypothetical protein
MIVLYHFEYVLSGYTWWAITTQPTFLVIQQEYLNHLLIISQGNMSKKPPTFLLPLSDLLYSLLHK